MRHEQEAESADTQGKQESIRSVNVWTQTRMKRRKRGDKYEDDDHGEEDEEKCLK